MKRSLVVGAGRLGRGVSQSDGAGSEVTPTGAVIVADSVRAEGVLAR